MMGHCFGAAGAIEAMMCVLAVHETACCRRRSTTRTRIPSATSTTFPNESREAEVDVALSNAMGLGGHNACVLVGRI